MLSEITHSNAESIDTGGNCIIAFSGVSCNGSSIQYFGRYADLSEWNNRIASWKGCNDANAQVKVSQLPTTTMPIVTTESQDDVFVSQNGAPQTPHGSVIFFTGLMLAGNYPCFRYTAFRE